MGRKNRNRRQERAAGLPQEHGTGMDEETADGGVGADPVSEAMSPARGPGQKTQKHKEKRFGHN